MQFGRSGPFMASPLSENAGFLPHSYSYGAKIRRKLDRAGRSITGVAVRINQQTATIDNGDGGNWRVPFHLLRHVLDI